MDVVGILMSLLLLMALAYRNHSVIVVAPVCALLAVVFDGDLPLLASYTQIFMTSLGQFIVRFFPLFLLGAIFGRLMDVSGSAVVIARGILRWLGVSQALTALVITCAILTYGGVSLFVVVFTVFPLGRVLFRQADVPARLLPGAIALGAFTFTMTALPGTVQIQNLIPMPFFETDAFAAPGMGLIASALMFVFGITWLSYRVRSARQAGESFDGQVSLPGKSSVESPASGPQTAGGTAVDQEQPGKLPGLMTAIAPLLILMVLNFVCSQYWVPSWETDYLAQKQFGATELSKVQGTWSTILAMLGGLTAVIPLNIPRLPQLQRLLGEGAQSSLMPVFNAASEFGYGSTIAALSGFRLVRDWMTAIAPGHPLVTEALSVNVLAGITGSASGGLSIAMEAMGKTFLEQGLAAGIDPGILHRVASLSSGGLDTLPHNAAVVTLLLICGLTHQQSYLDIFIVSVIGPILATACVIGLAW